MTSRNLTATFRFVSSRLVFLPFFHSFPPTPKKPSVFPPASQYHRSLSPLSVVFFFLCETAIISSLLPSASPGPSSIDFFDSVTANMGRTVDQEVHAAFVEFRAKEDDKVRISRNISAPPYHLNTYTTVTLLTYHPFYTIQCLSVQCIYCQQIRAKNTSRQKQHLLECPGLRGHPSAPQPQAQSAQATANGINAANGYPPTPNGPTAAATGAGPGPGTALPTPNGPIMSNGVNPHATPMQAPLPNMSGRGTLSTPGAPPTAGAGSSTGTTSQQGSRTTPKPKQKAPAATSLPSPPLDDVHAAFVEFRAKEEDKVRGFGHFSPYGNNAMSGNHDLTGKPQCLSVQCIYCQQVRAKNTSRQRQHLLECPTYLSVMKDSIPANNLLHTFPEGEVARSLQLPTPTLELDFRMSIKMNPRVSVGQTLWGQRDWVSFIGGQWAGRWGKGIILVRFSLLIHCHPSYNH